MCCDERVYGLHTLYGWRCDGDQETAQHMIALRAALIKKQRDSDLARENQQGKN